MSFSTKPIKQPHLHQTLAPDVAAAGPAIAPLERLQHMDSAAWENFVWEWADSLKATYARVEQCRGSGDSGRDVIGFAQAASDDPWDNYQCKHYDHRLMPTDIWLELGKLAYYTHIKEYSVPRAYWFVAPQGAGNTLSKLLRKPETLRSELITNWVKYCEGEITKTKTVPLDGALKQHVENLDMTIFKAASPITLIDQHRTTPWYVQRFGGGLPLRGAPPIPPTAITATETNYVRALLDVYEDRLKLIIADTTQLTDVDLTAHLVRARREFYSAESLREFSRDNVPQGTFDSFLDEVDAGIADVVAATHPDGYERVLAAVKQAKIIQLTANALVTRTTSNDRGGMCHQLANDKRVKWRK